MERHHALTASGDIQFAKEVFVIQAKVIFLVLLAFFECALSIELIPESQACRELVFDPQAAVYGRHGMPQPAASSKWAIHTVDSDAARQQTFALRQAQTETVTADNGEEIVFCMGDGLYVQHVDGSGRRRIVSKGAGYSQFMYPAWSLDGTKIAFGAQQINRINVDLVVCNADGSEPTVIAMLSGAYSRSYIQSVSWSWNNLHIMFTCAYDDSERNSWFTIFTVHYSGRDLKEGPGPYHSYCQYEPRESSTRYAYIVNATTTNYIDWFSELRSSNFDGSQNLLWFRSLGIATIEHIAWSSSMSMYSVVKNLKDYPGRQVLVYFLRMPGVGTQLIAASDVNGSLWSPTLSPDRSHVYIQAISGNGSASYLTLIKLAPPRTLTDMGYGFFPDWRQIIPQPLPAAPILTTPSPCEEMGFRAMFDLKWNAAAHAVAYNVELYDETNELRRSEQGLTAAKLTLRMLTTGHYKWRVQGVNQGGVGPWSPFSYFTIKEKDLLINGDFWCNDHGWGFYVHNDASANVSFNNQCEIDLVNGGSDDWHVQLIQHHIQILRSTRYKVTFDAWAASSRTILCGVNTDRVNGYYQYYSNRETIFLMPQRRQYSFEFSMQQATDDSARLAFDLGLSNIDVTIDNVKLSIATQVDKQDQPHCLSLPLSNDLLPNFPNPFNPSTTIRYRLVQSACVEIDIFDLNGKLIENAYNGLQPVGQHDVVWHAGDHPTGTYFCRFMATPTGGGDATMQTSKLLFLK